MAAKISGPLSPTGSCTLILRPFQCGHTTIGIQELLYLVLCWEWRMQRLIFQVLRCIQLPFPGGFSCIRHLILLSLKMIMWCSMTRFCHQEKRNISFLEQIPFDILRSIPCFDLNSRAVKHDITHTGTLSMAVRCLWEDTAHQET